MGNDEFYKFLGRITYSFARIDFLISNIATDLGIVKTPYEFYSQTNFKKKINSLKTHADKIKDENLKNDFTNWLDELDDLRQKRNTIIHSIILKNVKNDNEYRLYNYRKNGDQLIRKIYEYKTDDFKKIDQELIDSHNKGYVFWNNFNKGTGAQQYV